MKVTAARTSEVWYVTGAKAPLAHDETPNDDDVLTWLTHAKAVGTIFTACGIDASFWRTRWDLSFPVTASGPAKDLVSCQDCTDVLDALADAARDERHGVAWARGLALGGRRRASF